VPIGAEVTKPEAGATWKSNRDGSCSVGPTAPRSGRSTPIPSCHSTSEREPITGAHDRGARTGPAGTNDGADSAHTTGFAHPAGAAPLPCGAASTGDRHRRWAPRQAALTDEPGSTDCVGPGCRVAAHTGSEPIGRTAVDGPVDAATSSRSSGMTTACGGGIYLDPRSRAMAYTTDGVWLRTVDLVPRRSSPASTRTAGDSESIGAGDHTSPAQRPEPRRSAPGATHVRTPGAGPSRSTRRCSCRPSRAVAAEGYGGSQHPFWTAATRRVETGPRPNPVL
jgi:hypothetical protein